MCQIRLNPRMKTNYDLISAEDLIKQFHSDLNIGLNLSVIESQHQQFGYNEIPEKKPRPILKFLKKFWGITAWILEFIILLSIYLQNWENVIMVIGLLLMNATLGFFQEEKASKAVEVLKTRLQINAKVLRESNWQEIPQGNWYRETLFGFAREIWFLQISKLFTEKSPWINQRLQENQWNWNGSRKISYFKDLLYDAEKQQELLLERGLTPIMVKLPSSSRSPARYDIRKNCGQSCNLVNDYCDSAIDYCSH